MIVDIKICRRNIYKRHDKNSIGITILNLILIRPLFEKAYAMLTSQFISQDAGPSIVLLLSLSHDFHDVLHNLSKNDFRLFVRVSCNV
jgi:hypothetical protein